MIKCFTEAGFCSKKPFFNDESGPEKRDFRVESSEVPLFQLSFIIKKMVTWYLSPALELGKWEHFWLTFLS